MNASTLTSKHPRALLDLGHLQRQVFGKEYVNILLGAYFFLLGVASLTKMLRPFGTAITPVSKRPSKQACGVVASYVARARQCSVTNQMT